MTRQIIILPTKSMFKVLLFCLLTLILIYPALAQTTIEPLGKLYNFMDSASDIEIEGDLAFVAAGYSGLQIFDVSNPAHLRLIGSTPLLDEFAFTLTVHGATAIIRNSRSFWIVDVSDPQQPTIRSHHSIREVSDLDFNAELLCCVTRSEDGRQKVATILDYRNPERLDTIATLRTESDLQQCDVLSDKIILSSRNNNQIQLNIWQIDDRRLIPADTVRVESARSWSRHENLAYFFVRTPDPDLLNIQVYDLDNPQEVSLIGELEIATVWEDYSIYTFGFDRDLLYLHGYYYYGNVDSLYVINVEEPTELQHLGTFPLNVITEDLDLEYVASEIYQGHLICACDTDHLVSFNLRDPVRILPAAGYQAPRVEYVSVSGDLAFVTVGQHDLRLLDVSDPEDPQEICHYDAPGLIRGVTVRDNIGYFSADSVGLIILDLTDPRNPRELGRYDTPGTARGTAFCRNLLLVADGASELLMLDVSLPWAPDLVAEFPTYCDRLEVDGNWVFAVGACGLELLNVQLPDQIERLGEFGNNFIDVGVQDDVVLAAHHQYGLFILDLADPERLTLIDFYDPGETLRGLAYFENFAYILTEYWLEVVETANPFQPQQISVHRFPGEGLDLEFSNGLVYAANKTHFGIFDPAAIQSAPIKQRPHPTSSLLLAAYPNPFNSITNITLKVGQPAGYSLEIFDLKGTLVEHLFTGQLTSGRHNFAWQAGRQPAGTYYLVQSGTAPGAEVRKLVLVK